MEHNKNKPRRKRLDKRKMKKVNCMELLESTRIDDAAIIINNQHHNDSESFDTVIYSIHPTEMEIHWPPEGERTMP